jgi:hypothetical protein
MAQIKLVCVMMEQSDATSWRTKGEDYIRRADKINQRSGAR